LSSFGIVPQTKSSLDLFGFIWLYFLVEDIFEHKTVLEHGTLFTIFLQNMTDLEIFKLAGVAQLFINSSYMFWR
jgi:hypothetical protein